MLIIIAISAFLATLIGGLIAIRFRDKLHLILGFSAGAVIAVAFFDLLPESIELGIDYFEISTMATFVALGFIVYLLLDRVIFLHSHTVEYHSHNGESEKRSLRGILGAGSLSLHSFLDGVAVGLAFQVSSAVGIIVAIAVLVHDFSDGINTVGFIMKNEGNRKIAFKWLIIDAIAPVLGIVSTMFFSLGAQALSVILALFTGFFLYIGASDLIPESHHVHPKFLTTFMTILGASVLFVAIKLAGI